MKQSVLSWHILSYPRSGNHLVRALVEFASHRPKLGCKNGRNDPPIYLRKPNQLLKKIIINDENPIGFKSHSLHEAQLVQKNNPRNLGLVFVQRKMEEAIFSNSYRNLEKKFHLNGRELRKKIEQEIDFYLGSQLFYKNYDAGPKICINFEDITNQDVNRAMIVSESFLSEMGLANTKLNIKDFEEIKELARESQKSIRKKSNAKLEERIRAEISRYL